MPNPEAIFISYRRSDSGSVTGRIYDRLVSEFGRARVFKDVDSIPLGTAFAEELDAAVSECAVVLVVIGKTWVTVTEPDGTRRLDNPDDFVRIEVESALKRDIPVIPLLVSDAPMPKPEELPICLRSLTGKNGTAVGDDPRFHSDMGRVIKGLRSLLGSGQYLDKAGRLRKEISLLKEKLNKCFETRLLTTDPDRLVTLENLEAKLEKDIAIKEKELDDLS
ncbi:MAG: toll/interleukin-1 receptor domain-containing protein [Cyanobacteria bacterium P01_F01_bin.53]